DLLLRLADHLLERRAIHARLERRGLRLRRKREQVDARAAEALDGAVEPRVRRLERRIRIGSEDVGDDVQPLLDVIEDDDVVAKEQPRIGDAAAVAMRVWNPFGPSRDSVTEEADRAAEERRQRRLVADAQRPQLVVEDLRRLASGLVEAKAAPRIEADER